MRAARGGGRGGAGMAAATLFDSRVWILRPLLGMRREALRDVLRAAGQAWIDDPSNERETSERVRVRKVLGDAEILRLAAEAATAGARRQIASDAAAAWLSRAEPGENGSVRLPRDAFGSGDPVLPMRALLATVGGTPHLPAEAATQALIAQLWGGRSGALARALVKVSRSGFTIGRERRGGQPDTRAGLGAIAPWAAFLPGFDVGLRNAVARLVGVAAVPASPMQAGLRLSRDTLRTEPRATA